MLLFFFSCVSVKQGDTARVSRISYDLGVAAFSRGSMREALKELLKAADDNPKDPDVQHMLGLVYHSLGYPNLALTHYEKALSLKESFSEASNNYGILLMDLGRYSEAVDAFQKALSNLLYPTPFLAEGNMGWAYYQWGEIPAALKHLQHAVHTNPGFCRGYQWLARISLDQKKADEVLKYYEKFEKHCVSDAQWASQVPVTYTHEMMYYAGLAYLQKGFLEQASQMLKECGEKGSPEGIGRQCGVALKAMH